MSSNRNKQKSFINLPFRCVAGNEVTAENPWKYVTREVILDNIELHEESSEFLPIRNEIMEFPGKDILIGKWSEATHCKWKLIRIGYYLAIE